MGPKDYANLGNEVNYATANSGDEPWPLTGNRSLSTAERAVTEALMSTINYNDEDGIGSGTGDTTSASRYDQSKLCSEYAGDNMLTTEDLFDIGTKTASFELPEASYAVIQGYDTKNALKMAACVLLNSLNKCGPLKWNPLFFSACSNCFPQSPCSTTVWDVHPEYFPYSDIAPLHALERNNEEDRYQFPGNNAFNMRIVDEWRHNDLRRFNSTYKHYIPALGRETDWGNDFNAGSVNAPYQGLNPQSGFANEVNIPLDQSNTGATAAGRDSKGPNKPDPPDAPTFGNKSPTGAYRRASELGRKGGQSLKRQRERSSSDPISPRIKLGDGAELPRAGERVTERERVEMKRYTTQQLEMATNQVARSGNFPGGMNFLMTYHQGNVQMEGHTYCQKLEDGQCKRYAPGKKSALDLVNNSMSECWREFNGAYGGALNIFREGVYSPDDWGIMNMCSKGSLSGFFARYLGLGGLIVPGDLQLGTSNGMLTAWQQLGFSAGLDISTHADGYQYGFPVAFDGAYIDNNAVMASLLALEFLVAPHQRWCYCGKLKQWYGVYDPACDVVQAVTKATGGLLTDRTKVKQEESDEGSYYYYYDYYRAASPPTTESALLEWAAPVPGVDYMFSLVSTAFLFAFWFQSQDEITQIYKPGIIPDCSPPWLIFTRDWKNMDLLKGGFYSILFDTGYLAPDYFRSAPVFVANANQKPKCQTRHKANFALEEASKSKMDFGVAWYEPCPMSDRKKRRQTDNHDYRSGAVNGRGRLFLGMFVQALLFQCAVESDGLSKYLETDCQCWLMQLEAKEVDMLANNFDPRLSSYIMSSVNSDRGYWW